MAALFKSGYAGSGGTSFEYEKHSQNKKVEKIKVWYVRNKRVKAISIWLTGEPEKTYGVPTRPEGESASNFLVDELQMQTGEGIAEMQFWANKDGNRLGWIYIKTSKGRIWNVGGEKGSTGTFPVATGIWVGCYGGYDSDINRLGAIYINQTSLKLVNVNYPNLSGNISKAQEMSCRLHNNMDSKALTLQVSNNKIYYLPSKWSMTYPSNGLFEFSFFKPYKMQGGAVIPVLSSSSNGNVAWTLSSSTYETSDIFSETFTTMSKFNEKKDVTPDEEAQIAATIWQGDLNGILYDGYIQIGTSSTSKLSISGKYTGKTYLLV